MELHAGVDVASDDADDEIDYSDKNLLIQLLMNRQLSPGIPIKSRILDKYISKHYEASSVSLQGYRDSMEDEHLMHFKLKNHPNCCVFGVFDGHGGDLTAKFVKIALVPLLEQDEITEFDDKSLIMVMKQLDLKWIDFEKKRLFLKKKQLKQKLQEFENKNAMQFTRDSNGDNDNDQDNKDQEEDENDSKSETPVKQYADAEDDERLQQLLTNSLIDQTEKTGEKDTSHPINQTPSNEYGSVGTTCVFSIIQYNEKDDNYQVCMLCIDIRKLTNI